jgi:HNH endonuclease
VPARSHPGSTCRNDSCKKTAVAFGLCPRHYRWRHDGRSACAIDGCGRVARVGERLCRGHLAASLQCSVENCGRPVEARGLCRPHYKAERRPTCGRPGCERRAARRGLCQACYDDERLRGRECSVAGCERQQKARGWCALHYNRWYVEGDPGEPRSRRDYGAGFIDVHGYRMISVNGQARREHHVVMEQMLGRRLRPFERVHHRNGLRADNRPENLELWAIAHPPGVRVDDLVDWVVSEYADRVRERLAAESSR